MEEVVDMVAKEDVEAGAGPCAGYFWNGKRIMPPSLG